jgi:hypothetical protein
VSPGTPLKIGLSGQRSTTVVTGDTNILNLSKPSPVL